MNRALNYLGIARKAGLLEVGEENTGIAVRGGKAKLLLLASDASDNARSRARGFVVGHKTIIVELPFTKTEISDCVGKNGCSMAALCDIGLADSMMQVMSAADPEKFGETAAEIHRRGEKAKQRKSEAKAHQRNIRSGKRRTRE